VGIFGEKVLDWKFPRANDKQSFARNNVETGKILNRLVMMNAAMTGRSHGYCSRPYCCMAKVSIHVDLQRWRALGVF
jgi:hypothetical protein